MAIYREDILAIELESGSINRGYLNHTIGSGDQKANRFGVRLFRNGEPVSAESATVTGLFMAPDGTRYVISETSFPGSTGTEENKAYVQLPPVCYAVTGQYTLAIKLTGGGVEGTMRIIDGTVEETGEDGAVVPTSTIPTTEEIIAAYEQAVAVMGGSVRFDADQSLTSTQKKTARENIEAASIGQITELKGKHKLELNWNYGYINPSTLAISTGGTTHVYSDVFLVKAGTMLYVARVNKSMSTTLLCKCTADGTPSKVLLVGTSTGTSTGEHIMYPFVEDTYVRIGGNMSMSEYMTYYAEEFDYDITFDNDNFQLFNSRAVSEYQDGGIFTGGVVNAAVGYKRSLIICLPKGMTIEYWGCGSGENGILTLSQYDPVTNTFISALRTAASTMQHGKYTATDHMYIRLCARIAPNDTDFYAVLPEEKYYGWKIYYEPNHYRKVMNNVLYGKKITAMGDSLIYGNRIGPGATWLTNIGIKYNMTFTNLGDNANPVARVEGSSETAMVDRINTIPADTEYFILEGGSNDKNYNVPLGAVDSTDPETFNGALNIIVEEVRARIPKAKILLMTSYQRFKSKNSLNLGDSDYASAIVEAGKRHCVPVFNNFENCGMTFWDESQLAWIDEAKNRQKIVDGEVTYYQNVQHFSVEAYEWLSTIYEKAVERL